MTVAVFDPAQIAKDFEARAQLTPKKKQEIDLYNKYYYNVSNS